MKVPLRYQVSEFDCGTISLLNAFNYILERDEIPAIIIKKVCYYTLDCSGLDGSVGEGGTSRWAIKRFTKWLKKYIKNNNLKINCERLVGREVSLEKMKECIKQKGCILIRCYETSEHYVIITKIDHKYVYIFDPYYINKKVKDKELKIIKRSKNYNRRVTFKRLLEESHRDFSLGELKTRECVLFSRKF